jgi:LPXTG-motif cell wall-anchored protein
MNFKYLYGVTGVVLACAVGTVEPAYAQRRDGNLLPQDKSGQVTAVGCLLRGNAVRGGKADKYVLARPKTGPVASVTEASCTADTGADALTLDNPEKAAIKDSMLGRWVQITGRLESETSKDPDNLRELDVVSAKMVTVVPPPRAATAASRQPTPAAAAESRPAPSRASSPAAPQASAAPATGTTAARRSLPKTASQLPAIGLAGLLMLAGGFILRAFRLRQRG